MHNLLLAYRYFPGWSAAEVLDNEPLTGCGGWWGQETFPVQGPEAGSGPEGGPEKSAWVPTWSRCRSSTGYTKRYDYVDFHTWFGLVSMTCIWLRQIKRTEAQKMRESGAWKNFEWHVGRNQARRQTRKKTILCRIQSKNFYILKVNWKLIKRHFAFALSLRL